MSRSNSKKRRKALVLSIIVIALAALGTTVAFKRREPALVVQTDKVTRRNITEVVVANGHIQPVLQVKISPEVSGEIIALPVKEGQKVKKGDLLVKINPDIYVAARNSADAGYRSALASAELASANLDKARIDYERNRQLFNSRLISDSDLLGFKTSFEVAKAQSDSAQHQVDVANAALARAGEDLKRTTITSPIDGVVTKLNSELGEKVVGTAMMSGTEIMTVADLNEMEARVDVGEMDVVLIKSGQHAHLEVDAFRDQKFNGQVTEIADSSETVALANSGGQSQSATRFEVRIHIQEKEPFLPGMSVTAEIETRYRANVLCVPIQSVTTRLPVKLAQAGKTGAQATDDPPENSKTANSSKGGARNETNSAASGASKKPGAPPKPVECVFAVEGGRAKMVPVKLGISDDDYWEVLSGLNAGEEVVTGGYKAISRDLKDGSKIRKGPAPAAGANAAQNSP